MRTAAAVANTLDRVLFERYNDIQLLANEGVLREGTSQDKTNRLRQYKTAYRYYSWLGFTDAAGHLIASTDPSPPASGHRTTRDVHTSLQHKSVQFLLERRRSGESDGAASVEFPPPSMMQGECFRGSRPAGYR